MKVNILTTKNPSFQENFAVEELVFFLNEIANISCIVSNEINLYCDLPTISLGYTDAYIKNVGLLNLDDKLTEDGYILSVKNGCAYVCGGAGQGTIFGVYRLLKELFNLEIYTEKVYTYDKKPFVLNDLFIEDKPDIPMRTLGIYPVHLEKRAPGMGNKRYCYRLRLRQMDEGWGINNHSFFRVLPPSKYKDEHPDWYDESVSQLCLTNEGVISEYVKNMKKIIEDNPEDKLFMFGMEDTLKCCNCEKCTEMMKKYNGFSGLVLIFANRLAKELNAWLKVTHPNRKVYFFTFAYHWSIVPPVKKVSEGVYQPLFEDVKFEDNLGVLIAPLLTSANYALNNPKAYVSLSQSYRSDKKISLLDVFNGWRAVMNHIAVWTYNHNFYDYMTPCPMWGNFQQNFKFCKEMNSIHVFVEAGCSIQSNFAPMKIYVCSNLMWNNNLSENELIDKFMSVYYDGAQKELKEYFNYIHEHAKWMLKEYDREQIYVHFDDEPNLRYLDKRFWPKQVLVKCIEYFDNALKNNLTEEVKQRVLIESLPAKFSLVELYGAELDKDYLLTLIDEMLSVSETAGIKKACDHDPKTFVAYAEKWKKEFI